MRKFAEEYPDFEFVQKVSAQLHYTINLQKLLILHKFNL